MKKSRAAFTLVELLVATAVSTVLAGIIYTVGSEALFSFTRNISVNRCYSDARNSLDRIGGLMQSAGHTPVLINEDGSLWTATSLATPTAMTATQAAGIRFYCASVQPSYQVTTCQSTGSTVIVTIPTGGTAPKVGDLITIGAVGYQGLISAVSGTGTSRTLTMSDMSGLATTNGVLCNPDISTSTDITTLQNYCLLYNRVAFVAISTPALSNPAAAPTTANVSAATATELRYYPDAGSLTTSATTRNDPTKYKVLARLVVDQTDPEEVFIQRPRPFQILANPSVTTTLCVQASDYSNRANVISNANTFTRVQTSLGSRCPILLQGPY